MPVTVLTDAEADRALSLRVSRSLPLSPEISLCDGPEGRQLHRWLSLYQAYGLQDHPLVRLVSEQLLQSAMAASIGRSASYLDRAAHYASWLGQSDPVEVRDARGASPSSPTSVLVPVGLRTDGTGTGVSPCKQDTARATGASRRPPVSAFRGAVAPAEARSEVGL